MWCFSILVESEQRENIEKSYRILTPCIVKAFNVLGYGNDERLREAWELLNSQSDEDEKIILKDVLSKTYLPKERCGKPSKWATFYRLPAQRGTNI